MALPLPVCSGLILHGLGMSRMASALLLILMDAGCRSRKVIITVGLLLGRLLVIMCLILSGTVLESLMTCKQPVAAVILKWNVCSSETVVIFTMTEVGTVAMTVVARNVTKIVSLLVRLVLIMVGC